MTSYIIVGSSSNADLARVENSCTRLKTVFKDLSFKVVAKHEKDWPDYQKKVCKLYGFKNKTDPICFKPDGRLIGDADTFLDYLNQHYSAQDIEIDPEDLTNPEKNTKLAQEEYDHTHREVQLRELVAQQYDTLLFKDKFRFDLEVFKELDLGETRVFVKYLERYTPDLLIETDAVTDKSHLHIPEEQFDISQAVRLDRKNTDEMQEEENENKKAQKKAGEKMKSQGSVVGSQKGEGSNAQEGSRRSSKVLEPTGKKSREQSASQKSAGRKASLDKNGDPQTVKDSQNVQPLIIDGNDDTSAKVNTKTALGTEGVEGAPANSEGGPRPESGGLDGLNITAQEASMDEIVEGINPEEMEGEGIEEDQGPTEEEIEQMRFRKEKLMELTKVRPIEHNLHSWKVAKLEDGYVLALHPQPLFKEHCVLARNDKFVWTEPIGQCLKNILNMPIADAEDEIDLQTRQQTAIYAEGEGHERKHAIRFEDFGQTSKIRYTEEIDVILQEEKGAQANSSFLNSKIYDPFCPLTSSDIKIGLDTATKLDAYLLYRVLPEGVRDPQSLMSHCVHVILRESMLKEANLLDNSVFKKENLEFEALFEGGEPVLQNYEDLLKQREVESQITEEYQRLKDLKQARLEEIIAIKDRKREEKIKDLQNVEPSSPSKNDRKTLGSKFKSIKEVAPKSISVAPTEVKKSVESIPEEGVQPVTVDDNQEAPDNNLKTVAATPSPTKDNDTQPSATTLNKEGVIQEGAITPVEGNTEEGKANTIVEQGVVAKPEEAEPVLAVEGVEGLEVQQGEVVKTENDQEEGTEVHEETIEEKILGEQEQITQSFIPNFFTISKSFFQIDIPFIEFEKLQNSFYPLLSSFTLFCPTNFNFESRKMEICSYAI